MTIVDIYPSTPVFVVWCSRCGLRTPSDKGLVADLDAPPGTFYCPSCSTVLRHSQTHTQGDPISTHRKEV